MVCLVNSCNAHMLVMSVPMPSVLLVVRSHQTVIVDLLSSKHGADFLLSCFVHRRSADLPGAAMQPAQQPLLQGADDAGACATGDVGRECLCHEKVRQATKTRVLGGGGGRLGDKVQR